jgi:hypothetical protein
MAPPKDCEHISDIVLLDMTTSKKRGEFFGFVGPSGAPRIKLVSDGFLRDRSSVGLALHSDEN